MNVISKEELNIARESCALTMKELVRKTAHNDVLRKQLADLLVAIDRNQQVSNQQLTRQIESAETVLQIVV